MCHSDVIKGISWGQGLPKRRRQGAGLGSPAPSTEHPHLVADGSLLFHRELGTSWMDKRRVVVAIP